METKWGIGTLIIAESNRCKAVAMIVNKTITDSGDSFYIHTNRFYFDGKVEHDFFWAKPHQLIAWEINDGYKFYQ
jgi:hypothetical protein